MKKSIITLLALSFTLVFSFVYIRLFLNEEVLQTSADQAILYYLQVGAFQKEENAKAKVEEVKQLSMDCEYYLKDSLYYVVTGFSLDLSMKDGYINVLSSNGLSCYEKQLVLNDVSLIESVKDEKYDALLEVMRVSK